MEMVQLKPDSGSSSQFGKMQSSGSPTTCNKSHGSDVLLSNQLIFSIKRCIEIFETWTMLMDYLLSRVSFKSAL